MSAKIFADCVAMVTGAGSGIGLALARELARRGATVTLSDIDLARVEAAAHEIGGRATAHRLDVTDAAAVAELIRETAQAHGGIDYLFNNAGIGMVGEALLLNLGDWERLLEVNLKGVMHGVHAAYPIMVEQGSGHIVNVSSTAGLVPSPFLVPYSTMKHAVLGLSVSLRAEAKKYGVRVSVICPGFIDTDMKNTQPVLGIQRERVTASIPVKLYPVDRCARDILKGVAKDREIILVSGFTKWVYRARRWFPWVVSYWASRVFRKGM